MQDTPTPQACQLPPTQTRGPPALPGNGGGIAGKSHKTDLNTTRPSAGRGVAGDGMAARVSKSHRELKNKANPPKSFLKHWDWEKTQLTTAGRGRARRGCSYQLGRLWQRRLLYWHKVSKHPAQARANRPACSALIRITLLF